MNYSYEIKIKKINKYAYSQPVVKEYKLDETPNFWTLPSLMNWQEIDSPFKDSLVRTRKWLEKKYPEFSMGFLIFENGIYDVYEVFNPFFWEFSELNMLSLTENDSKISSFNRTKIWLNENHSELLL